MDAALESRIASLSSPARLLASCLSPHRRAFDLELCRILARAEPELARRNLAALLRELTSEGALVEDRGAYLFARSPA